MDCIDARHQDLSDIAVHMPYAAKAIGNSGEKGGLPHIKEVLDFFLNK